MIGNRRKVAENYTKYTENNIALFGAFFCFLLDTIYSYREFFTFSVKMPKITEPKKLSV